MLLRTARRKVRRAATPRERMIAETEVALLYGLRFPERTPRIPTVEVGAGEFTPEDAARFWSETLGVDIGQVGQYCRWKLRRFAAR